MSGVELFVIIFGLFFGYLIVSKIIGTEKSKSENQDSNRFNQQDQDSPRHEDRKRQQEERTEESTRQNANEPRAWHDVLQVPATASTAEIRRAYKTLMSQYHPDKVASMGPELKAICEARTKEINVAYDTAVKLRGNL